MLIIGHRGAAAIAPENTLASFNIALQKQCKGIELDVQLTKDEEFVVIHDYSVERTTNGSGYVNELTYKEIRELDAGSWFGENFSGQKVPSLAEVIELVPKDILLNIEIKLECSEKRNIEEKMLNFLTKKNYLENVVISSFDHMTLKKINEIDPQIKTGLLLYSNMINTFEYIEHNHLKPYSIHQTEEFLTKEFTAEAHGKGYKVFGYTINSKRSAQKCIHFGIDGMITDYPTIMTKD